MFRRHLLSLCRVAASPWLRNANWRRVTIATAACSVTAGVWSLADSNRKTVVEPYTKAAFEEEVDALQVIGVGLRSKYWLSVYAYAIYGHPSALLALAKLSDDDFFASFIGHETSKRIALRFQRDITGEDMQSAFKDSLGSRSKDSASLQSFQDQFKGLKLKSGTSLVFDIRYNKDGVASIQTSFEGQPLGTVSSTSLASALLDIYLGQSPISNDIKPSISARRKNMKSN